MLPVLPKPPKKRHLIKTSTATVTLTLALSSSSQAAVLFLETFDTPAANTAEFTSNYPTLSVAGPDPVSVSAGQFIIDQAQGFTGITTTGYSGDVIYSLGLGASNSNGSYSVGFRIGENNIAFHPGFAGGAFRIEGVGGSGNQGVGFTPDNNTLHRLDIRQHGSSGLFEITLTDGDNPANIFNTSFTNLASVGADFGPFRDGPFAGGGSGIYDNLRVEAVPEPTVLPLLGLSLLGLLRRRR